jgi:hypothetical protein
LSGVTGIPDDLLEAEGRYDTRLKAIISEAITFLQ